MTVLHPCRNLDFPECHTAVALAKIFTPTFLVFGLLGNVMAIVVLSGKRMNYTTTSIYLRFLAFVDIIVLLVPVLREAINNHAYIDISELTMASCKVHRWLASSAQGTGCWLLSVIALDRLVSVKYPVWAKSHCTKRLAAIIGIIITVFIVIVHSHFLVFLQREEVYRSSNRTNSTRLVDVKCVNSNPDYDTFREKVWSVVVLTLYNLLPTVCLIVCNVFLFKELSKRNIQKQLRKKNADDKKQDQAEFRSVTKMLIAVCTFFIIIYTPICVYLTSKPYIFDIHTRRDIAKRMLFGTVVKIVLYSNNIVNFIIYCLAGSVFRKQLFEIIRRCKSSVQKRNNRKIHPNGNELQTCTHTSDAGTSSRDGNQASKTMTNLRTVDTLVEDETR